MKRSIGSLVPSACVLVLLLAGCGSTQTVTVTVTPSGTPTPSGTSTPSSPVLNVTEFQFAMTLPAGISDAVYSVDRTYAGPLTDVNGRTATSLGDIPLTTKAIKSDAACSQDPSVATITVFSTDPTSLQFASGPSSYKKVGSYWLGYVQAQAACDNAVSTDSNLFEQAFNTARAT
jgi:hypothetical protein